MEIYTTPPEEIQEVDVIIAGGGTAGIIIASRIADAGPWLSVLIIEHGPDSQGNQVVAHPLLWRAVLHPQAGATLYYVAKNESQLAGRAIPVATGGILAGGSSMNLSIYTRPQGSDYDAWNVEGWTAEDLRPFANKAETYHGTGNKEHHGRGGPIQTERDFISAASQVGYSEVQDLHGLHSNLGVSHCLKYVSPGGKRQDVAHTYMHPRLQDGKHENLHVLVESQVIKVLFDSEGKRAVGVEYRPNPAIHKGAAQHGIRVLERSGIGDPEILKKAGVPVIADLRGVGRGYQDHQVISYYYKGNIPKEETSDHAFIEPSASYEPLLKNNDKTLGWNGFDVSAKIRPTEAEVDALGPEFQKAWERDFSGVPGKPLSTLLHITGPDLGDPPDFKLGFLTDDHDLDLKAHIWAYKKQREIARRMKAYLGEVEGHHPNFPQGSKAAIAEPIQGNPETVIEYTAEDDAAIAELVRRKVLTCWHGLGTCRMGPRDLDAVSVVDKNLNLYGVQGLKVADLSIAPENAAADTHNTALTIGEKAASIIIAELGLAWR
ncbi:alcohol oxidase-like protein [Hypoxylon crocopeplum]|nr:alcohol oxidase-like protein [Hypoxylon crocopeplum]